MSKLQAFSNMMEVDLHYKNSFKKLETDNIKLKGHILGQRNFLMKLQLLPRGQVFFVSPNYLCWLFQRVHMDIVEFASTSDNFSLWVNI